MGRKKLLALLPSVRRVQGWVRLNHYTEILADLPLGAIAAIKDKLNEAGPSRRDSARFSVHFDEESGLLTING